MARQYFLLKILIHLILGALVGAASALFLFGLDFVSSLRISYSQLIWGLPLFGILFGLILKNVSVEINQGVPYFVRMLNQEQQKVSFWTFPFILISSLGTHLFGGSAGREGVGVLMGAGISKLLSRFKAISKESELLSSGMVAGFSSIFGTPLAGLLFVFEIDKFRNSKNLNRIFCSLVASVAAYYITKILGVSHSNFYVRFQWDIKLLAYILIAGLVSGLGARVYFHIYKIINQKILRWSLHPSIKLLVGGFGVAALSYLIDGQSYLGLGTDIILKSFEQPMQIHDFVFKLILTVLTLVVGFKGGEVTPLFFMGATLSNSVLGFFHFNNFGLSAALGMVSLFGAVAGLPFTASILALELFGFKVGIVAFCSCLVARKIMGQHSIYQ